MKLHLWYLDGFPHLLDGRSLLQHLVVRCLVELHGILRLFLDVHAIDLDERIRLGLNLLGIGVDVVRGVELQWLCTVVVGR